MRRRWNTRVKVQVLVAGLLAAPMLSGCGDSPAVETPKEIPPAPQESSKASFEALRGQSKTAAPKAAPGK